MGTGQRMDRRTFLRLLGIGTAALAAPTWIAGCAVPPAVTDTTELARLINAYRVENDLPVIPVSSRLSLVAALHTADLSAHAAHLHECAGRGNLHSWSSHPPPPYAWAACCYADDHSNAACMWDKPREIAGYPADGYEIAYYSSAAATPASALASWRRSAGHNAVILNGGIWQERAWQALGAACAGNYACAWFGDVLG